MHLCLMGSSAVGRFDQTLLKRSGIQDVLRDPVRARCVVKEVHIQEKVLMKSLCVRQELLRSELQSYRLEHGMWPCVVVLLQRLFDRLQA